MQLLIRLLEVDVWWNLALLQRQCHLDDGRNTTRCLGVSDIRLDRAYPEGPLVCPGVLEDGGDGGDFDWVPGRRSRPVGLKIRRLRWVESGSPIAVADQGLLCLAAGSRDGLRFAVLVHAALPDDGADGISIAKGVVQPFQDHGRRPFATAIAVGAAVKRVRLAVLGDEAVVMSETYKTGGCHFPQHRYYLRHGRHSHEHVGVEHDVGASHNGHVRFP